MEVFFMSPESETFKIAVDNLKHLSTEQNVRFAEIQREKAIRDSFSLVTDAKHEAMKQGREQGREEGREEGLEQGMEKNRQAIALNMLKEGLDIALICKMTGLSEEEIKKLSNESNRS